MDSLAQLQRRKAALLAKIEEQRSDIKQTVLEIRQEFEPSKLLGKAISGVFGFAGKGDVASNIGAMGQLPAPIAFLFDVLVRNSKWAFLLKWVAPFLIRYWPNLSSAGLPSSEHAAPKPLKAKFYGQLRRGVSSLRGQLRNSATEPAPPPVDPEN